MPDRVYGIVLAGGRSRRMGRDKALVVLGGRSLLDRACKRLGPQCADLVVSHPGGRPDPCPPGYPVVADALPDHAGPLAGLLAGLDWIAERDPDAADAVSVAVDTPFLPRDLVARLVDARALAGATIALAASGGRQHPVAALWPVAIRAPLRTALTEEGLRRVGAFSERFAAALAHWPADPVDPFFNVNTPEDLAAAETIAADGDPCGDPQ